MMKDAEPVGWLETVVLKGSDEPIRVTLEERRGSRVLLHQVDPEDPEPQRVPIYEGDELVVMTAVSHMSIHTSSVVGDDSGFLFSYRVVPVRREEGVVYARTLRRGERDSGQRVHVRPGDSLRFEANDVVAELDHIDALEPASPSGHVPLTPVLWTWLTLRSQESQPERMRYLLAAARRLDTANLLLTAVEDRRGDLSQEQLGAPATRRALFELVGAVELAVVALSRAIDMVTGAASAIGSVAAVPDAITNTEPAVTAIRNAYEHIEDRALGNVHGRPDPVALTIFDHGELINRDRIVYGGYELDLAAEVPELLQEARSFFLDAAGNE